MPNISISNSLQSLSTRLIKAQIITAIIRPALAPLLAGDTIEDALSADIDQTSNYQSSAGTITSVTVDVLVNGETPAALDIPLDWQDEASVTVTVQDDASNERVFGLARTVGALAPDPFGPADWAVVVGEAFDADAAAYIAAVEAADDEPLEPAVKEAINDFVVGCKADAIWDAIKASCIMAGARTLEGALVPLVGDAPTNFNFVPADYDRVTGLKGDGATKSINTNRAGDDDPLNNNHQSVFVTAATTVDSSYIGGGVENGDFTDISRFSDDLTMRNRRATGAAPALISGIASATGFLGHSRSGTPYQQRFNGTDRDVLLGPLGPSTFDYLVFSRGGASLSNHTNGRLSFYSIGEALDLEALDTRVSNLMENIAFAVNTGLNPLDYDRDTIKYINAGYAAGGTLA